MPDPKANLPSKDELKETVESIMSQMSPNMMAMVLMGIILFFIILYIFTVVNKQTYNCKLIESYPPQPMISLTNAVLDTPLYKTYVKTAYNCCCSGDFKNDYVDSCALLNCAKQGVRALDFTVYSLHGNPVIAAATLNSNKYKEMYNSMPFSKTMTQVKQMFLYDTVNCSNTTDPLFLILRIQSSNLNIYNKMGEVLSSIFGDGNASGNKLYIPDSSKPLDTEIIRNLNGKVIVLVESVGISGFENTNLYTITALQLGTMYNQIYRESASYDLLESGNNPNVGFINVLYPDYQSKSLNFDFNTVGFRQSFQFIGLNFQTNDVYLDAYNKQFTSSILLQPSDTPAMKSSI
jgi:hypothetical protein